ncbi:unnamed protein product [Eruca vesicaria subsp. sativa]|uniref:H15 domain-containing protein n=1 Tax=Eruca vesicaria subsp. sativa TaxID=29727 RepID=A0ABC8JTK2_ERUVS|nr:unnamed protein product [Eruca vesicaria subsp. sativa]
MSSDPRSDCINQSEERYDIASNTLSNYINVTFTNRLHHHSHNNFSSSLKLKTVSTNQKPKFPMASPAVDQENIPPPMDGITTTEPVAKGGKTKKAKEVKAKKKKPAAGAAVTKKKKSVSTHPTYEEMIKDAIVSLKERTGSSQYAIQKFIEEKHKVLSPSFRKLLLLNLKRLVASEKLVKVKASFKIPSAKSSASSSPKAVADKKKPVATAAAAVSKPKGKKVTTGGSKSKVAKKSSAVKPKAKGKASVAPKRKAVAAAKPKAKAAKTSTVTSPGKKAAAGAAAKKKATKVVTKKKTPVKKVVKPKTVKSPVKRVSKRGMK